MSGNDQATYQADGITLAVRGRDVAVVKLSATGVPVEKHVVTTRATWREIVSIVCKVALALEYFDSVAKGRFHGTLRSSDINIRDNGGCVVCDFRNAPSQSPTSYTAPEQLSGRRPADQRTDIYRLGVVFYKLLTQREPFRAIDPDLLYQQIRDDIPQPPRQLVHGLPKDLDLICLRMLAKSPTDRILSGRQLADDLQGILRRFDDQVERKPQLDAVEKTNRRHLLIIHVETVSGFEFKTANELQELLVEFGASRVAWDDEELLLVLFDTSSQDEALARGVAIAARLLRVIFQLSQGTPNRYRLRVESAEIDLSQFAPTSAPEYYRVSDVCRRVPRVVGEVTATRIEVDHASWQSLSRWVDHAEENGVAELRVSTDGELLRVHILEAEPAGEAIGPISPLAIAKARWDQAKEGLGQMLLIIGEEGTGKTRLINQLVQQVEQSETSEVVIWTCIPRQQRRSFHPFARSLKQQIDRLRENGDERRSELLTQYFAGIANATDESTKCLSKILQAEVAAFNDVSRPVTSTDKEAIHELILRWLGHATKQLPVLFVVEDLQWADSATLGLVSRLAEDRLYEHLLVVATFRPEFETLWGSRSHQTQVALRRLPEKHIRRMLQSRLTTGAADDLMVEQVVRATGGVPLFLNAHFKLALVEKSARKVSQSRPTP